MPTYKRLFLRGLAALLPTLVTIVILVKLVAFVNNNFGKYIGTGLTYAAAWAFGDPFSPDEDEIGAYMDKAGVSQKEAIRRLRDENFKRVAQSWQMSVIGFFVAVVIVCIIGLFLASFVGRRLWRMVENTLTQVPLVKQIYPHVKQITDYVFGERKIGFSRVVAVQYPRKGIWALGFVTGPAIQVLRQTNPDYITIFIPSSPTPLTGYVITAHKEDTIDVPISVDQAFRYIISGGVITPDQKLPSLDGTGLAESGKDS